MEAATNINVALGEDTALERTVHHWFQKSGNAGESMENIERVGRSLVANDALLIAVEEDRRQPSREIAKNMGLSYAVIADHLKQVGMEKKLNWELGNRVLHQL
ncbi:hypothetical protein V3C99_001826 [Haemonchus contortus]|uniref:Transcriptional regulator n=1 Tax=Haemonchus contortus TaxID=6289 RepID=A0A7I5E905_HAECO|nr:Ccmar2 transposase [Haemonchus contortus]